MLGDGACDAAYAYAADNNATGTGCAPVSGPPGYAIGIETIGTVGKSVVPGTESMKATADATAVVEPRCAVDGKDGTAVKFICDGGQEVTVDPTEVGFTLNLAQFFIVHLSN
jgi:hypothetical protein